MQRLRIKSLQRLEGVRSSEEPALPTDDKGRLRSPPSRGPSREASPRETASEKSPRRSSRRDNDLTMKEKSRYVLDDLHGLTLARREQLKTPAVVVSVTELGEELVSIGKSPRCVLLLQSSSFGTARRETNGGCRGRMSSISFRVALCWWRRQICQSSFTPGVKDMCEIASNLQLLLIRVGNVSCVHSAKGCEKHCLRIFRPPAQRCGYRKWYILSCAA